MHQYSSGWLGSGQKGVENKGPDIGTGVSKSVMRWGPKGPKFAAEGP
jgi:hypothetical protein